MKIAEELGISVKTLHREIKRGMVELLNTDLSTREVYYVEFAQSKYDKAQKGTLACLLVLTERKTRLQLIRKLENRTSLHTEGRIKELIEEYPGSIKTLTSDNGSEFMKVDGIEGLGVGYFYAHSFSSWERGSNENNNKLIRRFIPKGTDITDIMEEELKSIEEWMNNYPRKLFNGKSSKEMYDIELKQYIS